MLASPEETDPASLGVAAGKVASQEPYSGVLIGDHLLKVMDDPVREKAEIYNVTAGPEETQGMISELQSRIPESLN